MATVQKFSYAFGAVYLVIGVLGFFLTGFDGFGSTDSQGTLILFDLNPLHNLVHLAIGVLWVASASSESPARSVSTLIGAVYLLVGVLGFFVVGGDLNILALNQADNILHVATAALALYFGLTGREAPASAS